jgi:peptidyl-dipeptidase A
MWTQTWNNILDISTPYPGKEVLDVTPQMKKQVTTQVYYIHGDQLCWFEVNLWRTGNWSLTEQQE